jgi:acetyl esterase/lipase
MRDAARAFAWTHREAQRLGGDPGHLVLAGHSAGAHIAAMLAYNDRFLREAGLPRSAVHSFVGLAGPYDFRPGEPAITATLSGEGDPDQAMPARFVRGGEAPSLLLIGDEDKRVNPMNQVKLAAALRAHGSPVDARVLPGYGHPGILARLAAPIRDERLLQAIVEFASR